MKAASSALFTVIALFQCISPFIADFNETHVYNPLWPGHAKFHNGQTMSMAVGLSTCLLWFTHIGRAMPKGVKGQSTLDTLALRKTNNDAAAMFAMLYWVTQISAIVYPGSTASDDPSWEGSFPQFWVSLVTLTFVAVAWLLESSDIANEQGKVLGKVKS